MSLVVTRGTEVAYPATDLSGNAFTYVYPTLCPYFDQGGTSGDSGSYAGAYAAGTVLLTNATFASLNDAVVKATSMAGLVASAHGHASGWSHTQDGGGPSLGTNCSGAGATLPAGNVTFPWILVTLDSNYNPSVDPSFVGAYNQIGVYDPSAIPDPLLTLYTIHADGSLFETASVANPDLPTLQFLFGVTITSTAQSGVYFHHFPLVAGSFWACSTLPAILLSSPNGTVAGGPIPSMNMASPPAGVLPGITWVAVTPSAPPSPSPLPNPIVDEPTIPVAPIGPPGYGEPGPYLPGYPIDYPANYTGGPLPGLPQYKVLLRGPDATGVLNGFFTSMIEILKLFADYGDPSFLRQAELDMNGNGFTNLEAGTASSDLARLDQVHR